MELEEARRDLARRQEAVQARREAEDLASPEKLGNAWLHTRLLEHKGRNETLFARLLGNGPRETRGSQDG